MNEEEIKKKVEKKVKEFADIYRWETFPFKIMDLTMQETLKRVEEAIDKCTDCCGLIDPKELKKELKK